MLSFIQRWGGWMSLITFAFLLGLVSGRKASDPTATISARALLEARIQALQTGSCPVCAPAESHVVPSEDPPVDGER